MRRALALTVATALACVAAGCGSDRPGKLVVVFIDESASVTDFRPYRDAWDCIVRSLQPRDRIIVGAITDETYTGFRPLLDREIPQFNWVKDNKLAYDAQIASLRAGLASAIDGLLAVKRTPRTAIIDSIDVAASVFRNDHRRPVLVLMSDMLEDSHVADFERQDVSAQLASQVARRQKRADDLPDLLGAKVYVVGASAATAATAHQVEHFWLEYIKEANGQLSPEHYGHALLSFDE